MIRRLFTFPALALLLVSLTGCLDWVQQTVTYRHDPKADVLRVFQNYEGIFGSDEPGEISRNEIEQYESVMKGQRTFFFGNWITEFTRAKIEELLADSLAAKPEGEGAELARRTGQKRDLEALLKLLLANVRIENGSFYLDAGKRLCGVQQVTISHVSHLVSAANRVLRHLIIEEAAKLDGTDVRRALLDRWLARKQDCLTVTGNRLLARWPMSRAEYDKALANEARLRKWIQEHTAAGGEVRHENEEIIVRVGAVADPQVAIRLTVAEKAYRTNFVQFLKGRQPVRETFAPAAAAAEFLNAKPAGVRP